MMKTLSGMVPICESISNLVVSVFRVCTHLSAFRKASAQHAG